MNTQREIVRDLEAAIAAFDEVLDGDYSVRRIDAVAELLERWRDRIEVEPAEVGVGLIEADPDVVLFELSERGREEVA